MPGVQDGRALPADSHVHTEWSWEAAEGSMERTCARAVELGLPSVAFTEHADFTPWAVPPGTQLPDHWQPTRTDALLERGRFDRILASVHSAPTAEGSGFTGVEARYADQPPHQLVRDYLAEAARMVKGFDGFEILAHIDYPIRHWPAGAPPHDPGDFEDDYRHVLAALAAAGKALEVNTRVPLHFQVAKWWHAEGGQSITFASDAHRPSALAHGFTDATQLAPAAGFRPNQDPYGFWRRA